MRILFLTQVLPYPLDAGPKVRAYYVLRYLAQRHAVTLVSFVRDTDTPDAVAHLAEFCAAVHTVPMVRSRWTDARFLATSLLRGQSFIVARDWSPAMARLLVQLAGDPGAPFDAVHADQLWMAPYALLVRDMHTDLSAPMTVLDQHNAVYLIPDRLAADDRNPLKRALLAREARRLAHYEATICRAFDRVTWVTREDFAAVARLPEPRDEPLPNAGVIPICADPGARPPLHRRPDARRVTFLGGLHYPPNAQGVRWFAERVFPQVLDAVPDAVLTVIGKQPPSLDGLGIPAANLAVTGYVADPAPYLAETAAFIVPLLAGGGMRVKIVDGWTWGLPMVSTTIGAEGTAVAPGENILLADTPADFAAATVHLLTHPDVGQRLSDAGRCTAEHAYGWRTIYQAWDRVYEPQE